MAAQSGALKARPLIDGAFFGPVTLKVIGDAFDQAWKDVAENFDSPLSQQAARLALASAILRAATEHSRDVDQLRYAGNRALVLKYPWLVDPLRMVREA